MGRALSALLLFFVLVSFSEGQLFRRRRRQQPQPPRVPQQQPGVPPTQPIGGGAVRGGAASCSPTPDGDGWMERLNYYRCQAGLPAVTVDPSLQEGARLHSCWMAVNGRLQHDEDAGTPGSSAAGDRTARNSDLGMNGGGGTRTAAVDLLLTAPFHAGWLLQHNLRSVAYADCRDTRGAKWYTLNVIDGLSGGARPPSAPVFWPGQSASVSFRSGSTGETPNPGIMCGFGDTTGLPIVAMLPQRHSRSPVATVTNNGRSLQVCVIWVGNVPLDSSQGRDAEMWRDSIKSTMSQINSVYIVPREQYQPGTVAVTLDNLSWSFNVQ